MMETESMKQLLPALRFLTSAWGRRVGMLRYALEVRFIISSISAYDLLPGLHIIPACLCDLTCRWCAACSLAWYQRMLLAVSVIGAYLCARVCVCSFEEGVEFRVIILSEMEICGESGLCGSVAGGFYNAIGGRLR
ncbi:hypothetical protein, unlikely [Trypanosoma congolense IL3000]|uniref:Uncharacterized protein n=1 Tax=Trypanosoma congolense (strain IL3000) TaxID=1068625 RepID=F9WH96_TRYCI|nr:hypothetical protein, unlikely [Trypanosoma congolense IL3000]